MTTALQNGTGSMELSHEELFRNAYETLDTARSEIGRFVLLSDEDLYMAVATPMVGSHMLLEGPPGTVKTTLAKVTLPLLTNSTAFLPVRKRLYLRRWKRAK
jgi:MoxR-like ATPase